MELEEKTKDSTLKIGNTKISLLKENFYTIESNSLILDSINENITHHSEHISEHQRYSKQVKMTPILDTTGKDKTTKKTICN